jgi:ankyrin repeat protein
MYQPRATAACNSTALLYREVDRYSTTKEITDLLDQGASRDALNRAGWTVLHLAVIRNATDVIPLLITAANLDRLGGPETNKATPLMLAAAAGHVEAVRTLLAAGADVRRCTPSGRNALGDALAGGHGGAADWLWWAAQRCADSDTILAAVKAASAANAGVTPLATAAKSGLHQLVPLLATPHHVNLPWGNARFTPLHLAVANNHNKAAEALLNAGAAVNVPDQRGLHPLDVCCPAQKPAVARAPSAAHEAAAASSRGGSPDGTTHHSSSIM